MEHAGEEESLILEGDVGGGLVLRRKISIAKDNQRVFRIASSIEARSVGAGSGGFSRFVYLLQAFLFLPLCLCFCKSLRNRENLRIKVPKTICNFTSL